MTYLETQVESLVQVMERAVQLKVHRLAGHVANLDFWTEEARRCIQNLDEYNLRYSRMQVATQQYHIAFPKTTGTEDKSMKTQPTMSATDIEAWIAKVRSCMLRFLNVSDAAGLVTVPKFNEVALILGLR